MPLYALLFLASACGDASPAEEELTAEGRRVFSNPEEFVGDEVTVTGEITEFLSTGSFRLAAADDILLVVGAEEPNADEGTVVEVTGKVRAFDILAFEDELGTDLNTDELRDFEGEHAIVAEAVNPVDVDEDDEGS